jgi:MinD-like ATPase involved in chromosome partitioning or flagellar assembly
VSSFTDEEACEELSNAGVQAQNLADEQAARSRAEIHPLSGGGQRLAPVGRRQRPTLGGPAAIEPVREDREDGERALDGGRGARPRAVDDGSLRARPAGVRQARSGMVRGAVAVVARWLVSSRGEVAERAVDARLRSPAANSRMNVVTVAGQRGGVGKTSMVVSVGGLLANVARLNVVAVDADLDYGPLADHVPDADRSERTVVDLLGNFVGNRPVPMPALRRYLSRTPSGLRVLAAPRRREEMRALTSADLDRALGLLSNFDVCLLDCAAGVERDLAPWATRRADRLVVVSTGDQVGARNVAHAISQLPLQNAILAINKVKATDRDSSYSALAEGELFAELPGKRLSVRYDERLHEMLDRAELDVGRLERATRLDLKRLAAAIAEGLT